MLLIVFPYFLNVVVFLHQLFYLFFLFSFLNPLNFFPFFLLILPFFSKIFHFLPNIFFDLYHNLIASFFSFLHPAHTFLLISSGNLLFLSYFAYPLSFFVHYFLHFPSLFFSNILLFLVVSIHFSFQAFLIYLHLLLFLTNL